jgi:hypothetical protein
MKPIFSKDTNWAGVVGLFVLNFGSLDLLVSDILKARLASEEFERLREKHFKDRTKRVFQELQLPEDLILRIENLRSVRNHVAHAYLEMNTMTHEQVLVVPKDADAETGQRRMTFEDLLVAHKELADVTSILTPHTNLDAWHISVVEGASRDEEAVLAIETKGGSK